MKSIVYLLICIKGFPLYGIFQEMAPKNLKVSQITSFGWETNSKIFLLQEKEETPTTIEPLKLISYYLFDLGFNTKQINSTSQFNHFSIHQDLKETQLRKQLDPNRNYPNRGIYTKKPSCQPYPLVEVKAFKDFYIGI